MHDPSHSLPASGDDPADALGRRHRPFPGARIVSLVPSITELLCTLGLAGQLVGRTGFCIHPRDILASIPKVGGTKDVNVDKVRALAPTHVVVNIDENDKPLVERLAEFVPHIVVTHPNTPRDNLALARLMGAVFCVEEAAARWCAAFEREYAALRALRPGPPRTVLYCIWQDPWMTVSQDTYIASMLAELGWRVPALPDTARYPRFNWSDDLVDGLDAVLLSTEPHRFTERHADALERQIGIPVLLVDGEMMSWYGSRALEGLRYLRRLRGMLEGEADADEDGPTA
ncbi:ABC transporter substrate-binding protein [Massilia forsythiae]|uniref:ABC transporter substrate-binding protein n=1 Tax=Massilia forsythiae TaxID=2728020 RepID=A0A7Z2VTP3_9BURK|nr:helical backbone metal receptor [Massilia forsythiae]QJD98922.1 ABC transporter substrate-binding protein [Massilia forsythiae]